MQSRVVLVTGAFGNLGRSVVKRLLREGQRVRAFDLPTRRNRRAARAWPNEVEVMFGDLTQVGQVERAVQGVDAVIHLAAILPPASERRPELARAVNLEGTRRLIAAAQRARKDMPFVFSSSCAVYGPSAGARGLAGPDSPTEATDVYTETKLGAEAVLRESSLAWVILRLGAAIEDSAGATDPIVLRLMFEIDPDNPIELVHGEDVATALVRATQCEAAYRRILPVGGGPSCRLKQRDLLNMSMGVLGIGPLPDSAFGRAPYYTCWLDTQQAQQLLRFQEHDLSAIQRDLAARFARLRPLTAWSAPLLQRALLLLSGPHQGRPPRPSFRALIDAGY
jgi:UDP-glucose 4-epimerase